MQAKLAGQEYIIVHDLQAALDALTPEEVVEGLYSMLLNKTHHSLQRMKLQQLEELAHYS